MSANHDMRLILSLDPNASLKFSVWTARWYVQARIEVSDGVCLSGLTEHRRTPEEAVSAFAGRLRAVTVEDFGRVVVVNAYSPDRRQVRWNGAAFVDALLEGQPA